MPDIFISYARGDRKRVAMIAGALEAEGFSIGADDAARTGRAWRDRQRAELQGAACVIVCWSRASAKSDVVLEEATQGYNQQKLIPVTLQACDPPMPFNMVASADLTTWRGESDNEYWVETLAEARRLVGRQPRPAQAAAASPSRPAREASGPAPRYQSTRPRRKKGAGGLIGGGVIAAAAFAGAVWAAPGAFRYIRAKLEPTPQIAAIVAGPVDEAPPKLTVTPAVEDAADPPAIVQPAVATTPPPARKPERAPSVRPEASAPPLPSVAPAPVMAAAIAVSLRDLEACLRQVARACGGATEEFRADGRLSGAESRLLAAPLFPDGVQATEANLAACKANATRRAMNTEQGKAACAAAQPLPAAVKTDAAALAPSVAPPRSPLR